MRRPFGGVEPDRGPAPGSERAPSPDRGASGEGPKLAPAYARAGVRLEAKPEAVRRIRDLAASTRRSGWLGDIGSFGGLFDLDAAAGPASGRLLVAGADGVGTKLKLAIQLDRHDTVGQDAVAMCVNDILCHGAEPLFFLDYLATGRLDPERVAEIVGGVVEGCRLAGCALIGGETAEMPGMYEPGEYDLAGFAVGAVAPERLIDGRRVRAGDRLVGLASSGPHSNGFSLIRRIVSDRQLPLDRALDQLGGRTLGEALLEPTRIYVRTVLALLQEEFDLRGIAHITGGGLVENLPRALGGLGFELEARAWEVPAVLRLLAAWGGLGDEEMVRVFNCGLGLVLAVPEEQAEAVRARAEVLGERAWLVGEVTETPSVRIGAVSGARSAIAALPAGADPEASPGRRSEAATPVGRVRLAVLASGRGSNLRAILEACRAVDYPAEVAVVISDRKDAPALEIARGYGVPTEVVELRPSQPGLAADRVASAPGPAGRAAFEAELAAQIEAHGADLVCLAGFMRLLGPTFLDRFPGRVLNIHPSLLPSFPGLHAQRQALEHGVAVTGCTVHLVDEGLDSGPIILQRAVPVLPGDTEESLSARILAEEHRAYPEAIRLVAEGRLRIEGRRVVVGRVP